jgi:glycosyltransferase involved in cell wall biosynthesis
MARIAHLWQATYPWEVRVGKVNRSLVKLGHEPVTFARRAGPPGEVAEAVVEVHGLPVPFNFRWPNTLARLHAESPFSAIIVRDLPLAWAGLRFARRHGVPCILDMAEHYPAAMRMWEKYASGIASLAVRQLRLPDRYERAVVPRFDQVWVVCQEMADRLVREFRLDPNSIVLVGNTPEAAHATVPRVKPVGATFAYLGIWCEDRRLDVVLRGFDMLAARVPTARLELHGGGESEARLRQIHGTLRHADRIELRGRFAPNDYWTIMTQIDYGIVSLSDSEFTRHTIANKFFDYPAAAVPMLYTELPPLTRVANQMHCGVGFAPEQPESFARAAESLLSADYGALSASGLASIQSDFLWEHDERRLAAGLATLGVRMGAGLAGA